MLCFLQKVKLPQQQNKKRKYKNPCQSLESSSGHLVSQSGALHLALGAKIPGSIPGSGKGFYVWFFVLLLLSFYFFVKNTLFVTKHCNFFYNFNLFCILKIYDRL